MTTTRNLQLLALFLENDELFKNCLLKKIGECIQIPVNSVTPRRVTALDIFELSKMETKERELKITRIKELEILDIFLSKNHVFAKDREKIEAYSSLNRGIVGMYSGYPNYEDIKQFFLKENDRLAKFAAHAEKKRKSYLGKQANLSNEKDILIALKLAPLGSDIMVEILYDLYHNKLGIGTLGENLNESMLKSISSDKSVLSRNPETLDPVHK
jgi:hypothetical protein